MTETRLLPPFLTRSHSFFHVSVLLVSSHRMSRRLRDREPGKTFVWDAPSATCSSGVRPYRPSPPLPFDMPVEKENIHSHLLPPVVLIPP
jgi:hypothetical protein